MRLSSLRPPHQYSRLTPKGQPIAMDRAGKARLTDASAKVGLAGATALIVAPATGGRGFSRSGVQAPLIALGYSELI